MSRSAPLLIRLARYVAGEAAPPARVRVPLLRERLGEGSSDLRGSIFVVILGEICGVEGSEPVLSILEGRSDAPSLSLRGRGRREAGGEGPNSKF